MRKIFIASGLFFFALLFVLSGCQNYHINYINHPKQPSEKVNKDKTIEKDSQSTPEKQDDENKGR